MQLTPENTSISRNDIQALVDANKTKSEVFDWLTDKGMTSEEIAKVLSDLDSYR